MKLKEGLKIIYFWLFRLRATTKKKFHDLVFWKFCNFHIRWLQFFKEGDWYICEIMTMQKLDSFVEKNFFAQVFFNWHSFLARHGVIRKRSTKRLKHTRNLLSNSPYWYDKNINFLIFSTQKKPHAIMLIFEK